MLDITSKFESICRDKDTLRRLTEIASDRERWHEGYALFQDIRQKTLIAERGDDDLATAQYAFEEVCAKTLYNLSGEPAPFDPDSAFWVLPLAVDLGRRLGLTDIGELTPLLRM